MGGPKRSMWGGRQRATTLLCNLAAGIRVCLRRPSRRGSRTIDRKSGLGEYASLAVLIYNRLT